MSSLEKEALLLDLIPIAFNEELEGEIQTFSVFVKKKELNQHYLGFHPYFI